MPEKAARSGATYAAHYADVHVLVRFDGQLLMGRRRHPTVFPRMFQIPAGLLEEHESARHGAARELREETGILVSPENLRFVHVMHHVSTHAGDERIAFFFETDHPHEEVDNPEPHRCDGWFWHKMTDLPQPMPPYLNQALKHIALGIQYSEYAWPLADRSSPSRARSARPR
ncbi:NUDIX domain-containing protein [Streptomyces sp. NK15101]|uniref:NUDIX domain-containing protein n=1 Tax=Streptomyces sp. NK15101 TaxID=2873261 RepID=UPI001CECF8CD|nr:NUDIX domain-containing protein [Streptomyces sp. NK15101]